TETRQATAARARTTSTSSKTFQASPLGSYQSTNRLTSRRTAPRATSPVPASNRSRKRFPFAKSGSLLSETDRGAQRIRWSPGCGIRRPDAGSAAASRRERRSAAADDGARLGVHAGGRGARRDPDRHLALGDAVAGQHG